MPSDEINMRRDIGEFLSRVPGMMATEAQEEMAKLLQKYWRDGYLTCQSGEVVMAPSIKSDADEG